MNLINFEYNNNIALDPNKIKIGSFGFGFASKNYENLCRCVRENFIRTQIPVELRLHLTKSHFLSHYHLLALYRSHNPE